MSRFVETLTNARLTRSEDDYSRENPRTREKLASSTIVDIDGTIRSAEATMCTRTSNKLKNTLSKKAGLRPGARLWRGSMTTQTSSFTKTHIFCVLCLQ